MNTIEVLRKLEKDTKSTYNTEVFITGGFVRDLLRKKRNMDLDVVVRFMPLEEIQKYLSKFGKTKMRTMSHTNTTSAVTIVIFRANGDDMEAQITSPKGIKKGEADIKATLKQDSSQRDFTVNAMYIPINRISSKNVIDYWGGKNDIAGRQLLTVGSAKARFIQSPIRIMRAFALASRFNYNIAHHVKSAITENAHLLKSVPQEAIRAELEDILLSQKPSTYLKMMQKLGVLKVILPELDACAYCVQDKKYHKYNVFNHLVYTCDFIEPTIVLRLAGLFHDIGKPTTKSNESNDKITFHKHEVVGARLAAVILKRLCFDTKTIEEVTHLIRMHMYHYTREYTDAGIRRFIVNAKMTENDVADIGNFPLFKLRIAERLGNGFKKQSVTPRQKDFEERIQQVFKTSTGLTIGDLAINGKDLIEIFSMKPSKDIGVVLSHLLNLVLEDPSINNRNDLLHCALDFIENRKET